MRPLVKFLRPDFKRTKGGEKGRDGGRRNSRHECDRHDAKGHTKLVDIVENSSLRNSLRRRVMPLKGGNNATHDHRLKNTNDHVASLDNSISLHLSHYRSSLPYLLLQHSK
jgi:hypothetical protein